MTFDNLIVNLSDIPSEWVFEYYLGLGKILDGKSVNIKSAFNNNDKTPSMYIYIDDRSGEYIFKDFSSGYSGNKFDLVKYLFSISYIDAIEKTKNDFLHDGCSVNKTNTIKQKPPLKIIKEYNVRDWNKSDMDYWGQFNISKDLLEEYNVKPILNYYIKKGKIEIGLHHTNMYGYFNKFGQLYKVYQPNKKTKFIVVDNYLQGLDQLKYHKTLFIVSSKKDGLSLKSIFNNIDFVAPYSENTLINPYLIRYFKMKYKNVIVVLDNDTVGKSSINEYKKIYNIKGFCLDLDKDIADAVKNHGVSKTKKTFIKQYNAIKNIHS